MPVPAAISIAPAALGALASGAKAIAGNDQLKKDKAELGRLKTPFYKIQDEYDQNRWGAAELAGGGYTQEAKDFFSDQTSRGLGSSISGTLQARGSVNDINKIFDSYNNSVRNFAAEDSQKQIDNIRYFHKTNSDLAGQKTMQWAINEYQPYQNKLKELTQRISADKQNVWQGIQGVVGAGQAAVTGLQNNALINSSVNANNARANLFNNMFSGGNGVTNTGAFNAMTSAYGNAPTNFNKFAIEVSPGSKNFTNQALAANSELDKQQEFADMIGNMTPEEFQAYMQQFSGETKQFQ